MSNDDSGTVVDTAGAVNIFRLWRQAADFEQNLRTSSQDALTYGHDRIDRDNRNEMHPDKVPPWKFA